MASEIAGIVAGWLGVHSREDEPLPRREQKRLFNYWRKQKCPACGSEGGGLSLVRGECEDVAVWFNCGSYFWGYTGGWVIMGDVCKLYYYERLAKDRAARRRRDG